MAATAQLTLIEIANLALEVRAMHAGRPFSPAFLQVAKEMNRDPKELAEGIGRVLRIHPPSPPCEVPA